MSRAELLAKIQEVGDIKGPERAKAVLRTVLDAFRSERTPTRARRARTRLPADLEPDWRVSQARMCDLFEREEMLCEEDVPEAH